MTIKEKIAFIRGKIEEGCTDEQIQSELREVIVARRNNAWKSVAEVYKRTGSMQRTSEELGVTIPSVRRWLMVQGVKINKQGGLHGYTITAEAIQVVINLSKQGVKVEDIRQQTGVTRATIYNIRKRNGINKRPTAEQLEKVKAYKGRTMNPATVAKICGVTRYQVLKCWYD